MTEGKPAADLLIVNATIHTMDVAAPRASGLAAAAGRIVAVGDDAAVRSLAAPHARIIDAGGRLVLPGFQDTHIHLQDSGTAFAGSANLESARSLADLQHLIRDFAASRPGDVWVNGTGWYTGIFGEHNLNRTVLDQAVADRPLYIHASDGHSAALNSAGCRILGLDAGIADPPNGRFARDAQGVPTGVFHESAVDWVRERMPPITEADYAAGVRYGQSECNRHGITGVLDALVEERHMRIYKALEESGELSVRIAATAKVYPEETVESALARLVALRERYRSPLVYVHSAKFFLDGVFENRTAAMIAPYSDGPGDNAPLTFEQRHLESLFIALDRARFQIHAHVIGDKAVRAALDALAAARRANGAWPSLHQLAHVQVVDPADVPRFRELGVVANIQPLWARLEPSVTEVALPMVGPERGRWMYPFRSLKAAGAMLAVSSDWGVSTLNPFAIMHTAVTRRPADHRSNAPPFLPEQCLDVATVVRGYTVDAAASAWRSADTGSLAQGKLADLIILDRDVFSVSPGAILDTRVLLTLLGGREVHRAPEFSG
jgi:predicted amidohydrolase YtcJ